MTELEGLVSGAPRGAIERQAELSDASVAAQQLAVAASHHPDRVFHETDRLTTDGGCFPRIPSDLDRTYISSLERSVYAASIDVGIARSASHSPARSGSLTGRRNSSTPSISMLSSRCRKRLRSSPSRTSVSSTISCFAPRPRLLRTIAADPAHLGAEIGFLSVLHTWGQNLLHHPHLHCLVPGGGISPDGERWIACRPGFFLPVRVLSRLFRGLFLHYLGKAFTAGRLSFFSTLLPLQERSPFLQHLARVRTAEWVVYAKPPFAGPHQVLSYVGRYTHRIAISNSRLLAIDDGKVRFRWKDYRRDNRHATMTLTADEIHSPVPDPRPA